MNALGDTSITQYVPESWTSPFFGWNLDLDWSGTLEAANAKIASDGYTIFGAFFMMMIFKGILVSAAGPAPNYDMQKILATKSPSDAAKMSGSVSVVLMPFRYLMIAGFTVLALLYFDKLNLTIGERVDFEQILPSAMADLKELFPVGVMGLLLAGLLAAFMSTFAGTLNAAQAYVVNDIYLKYIKPDASNKQVSNANYIVGIITVLVSIVFGVFAKDVNSILQWIVSALWGSYVASNVLKWHWWRFNGNGYFWGMVAGIIPAMVFPMIFHSTLELYYFPLILLISILGCIAGTYSSKPTDENVLKDFYKNVRPWGFWEPIKQKVKAEDPSFEENKFFYKDMFNVAIGIIAQTALVALPIYLVIKEITPMIITIIITVICFIILKKTWWNSLKYRDH
jgi:Na+/proline symporter